MMLKLGEGCQWLVQSWFGQKSGSASNTNAMMVNLNFQQNQPIIWFAVYLYFYCNSFHILFLYIVFCICILLIAILFASTGNRNAIWVNLGKKMICFFRCVGGQSSCSTIIMCGIFFLGLTSKQWYNTQCYCLSLQIKYDPIEE